MNARAIAKHLQKALRDEGPLDYTLYALEMEEHIDYWYEEMLYDQEDIVLAVDEKNGRVAMLLITRDKTVYVNEEAREKLKSLWPERYDPNMKLLIPSMAEQLASGYIAVTGVMVVDTP